MSKKAKSVSRIYAVTRKGHGTLRLVKAGSWAQALRHVAKDEYTVDVAEQDQLVEAVNRGVKVEIVLKSKPLVVQVDPARISELVEEHASRPLAAVVSSFKGAPLEEAELPGPSPLVRGEFIDPTLS